MHPRAYHHPTDAEMVVAMLAELAATDPTATPVTLEQWSGFVARSDGQGGRDFAVVPDPDNPERCVALMYALAPRPSTDGGHILRHLRIQVLPRWRRQGLATRLLQWAAECPIEGPQPMLQCSSPDDWTTGAAFAAHHGARPVLRELTLKRPLSPTSRSEPRPEGLEPHPTLALRAYGLPGDDHHWARLHNASYAQDAFLFTAMTPGDAVRQVAQEGVEVWFASVHPGHEPQGFCMVQRHSPTEGWIESIAVHPQARQKGLGRALLTTGLEALRRQGCTEATLCVEEGNTAAIRLYHEAGFVTVGGWTTWWLSLENWSSRT
ncbi:MAG: GNAT family N-acetyltransferase [Myxococcota bacterium]